MRRAVNNKNTYFSMLDVRIRKPSIAPFPLLFKITVSTFMRFGVIVRPQTNQGRSRWELFTRSYIWRRLSLSQIFRQTLQSSSFFIFKSQILVDLVWLEIWFHVRRLGSICEDRNFSNTQGWRNRWWLGIRGFCDCFILYVVRLIASKYVPLRAKSFILCLTIPLR